ncbi:MAG: rod shape-determining protein RodA, partial [Alphaproteobacteria bacterium]|nr:rod shape-determining protein RodA [Alphaproteobacteria bacterium]
MSFFKDRNCYLKNYNLSLMDKIRLFSWPFLALICLVVFIGLMLLYSAGNGNWAPWASKQFLRFLMSLGILFFISLTNLRLWMKYAYVIYGLALILLLGVEFFGHVGMGAQRWLNLGFMKVQPSEVMKIALVLALARYFHGASLDEVRSIRFMIPPLMLMGMPVSLILLQPDLGTALMLVFASVALFFLVGVQIWKFVVVGLGGLISIPVLWMCLHDYQKQRVLTFLNPESDPRGAGYHIMQSKITLGSGGVFGKGFMEGTQSRLNFLPEKQTDFIFTVLSEEFGLVGSLFLLFLYGVIIAYGFMIGLRCNNFFGKLLAFGLTMIAGLSTGIGSIIAFFAKKTNKKFLSISLGFSAGVMIFVSMIEIYQKAQEALVADLGQKP